jgi:hypothetical protein
MTTLGVALMHDESFQDVHCLFFCLLVVEIRLQVDFCGKLQGMVQFDFIKGFQVEDQSLEVYEEERGKRLEAMILLYGFYFGFAVLAVVIADDFRFDEFVEAILEVVLIFDFHCEDVEILYSLLYVVAFLAADYV